MLIPFLTIFFVSSALLSYEILLMRLLAIINWGHYAYMVVSISMLGLGFSGVLLVFGSEFFKRYRNFLILTGCFLFSVSVPVCFYLSSNLPLNYLYLIWDIRQFLYIMGQFFLYSIPFLIASTILALFFTCFGDRTGKIYAFNLAGSGAGVVTALVIMYLVPPERYLSFPSIFGLIAGGLWSVYILTRKWWKVISICLVLLLIPSSILFSPDTLLPYMCQYKGLPGLLRLPDTRITHTYYSPLGIIHTCQGKHIRITAGLSLNFTGKVPGGQALTVDGGAPMPIYNIIDPEDMEFLDWTIFSSAYHLSKDPSTLIIGVGGGRDILLAMYHKSRAVRVLEIDPEIVQASA
ncbi:MAG: hypothetical protein NC824_03185, partial [Candidatus Omnitrophica bacterium]|nr:hypothetical protein [Candidatus Omnitrophota bacterium]